MPKWLFGIWHGWGLVGGAITGISLDAAEFSPSYTSTAEKSVPQLSAVTAAQLLQRHSTALAKNGPKARDP